MIAKLLDRCWCKEDCQGCEDCQGSYYSVKCPVCGNRVYENGKPEVDDTLYCVDCRTYFCVLRVDVLQGYLELDKKAEGRE